MNKGRTPQEQNTHDFMEAFMKSYSETDKFISEMEAKEQYDENGNITNLDEIAALIKEMEEKKAMESKNNQSQQ